MQVWHTKLFVLKSRIHIYSYILSIVTLFIFIVIFPKWPPLNLIKASFPKVIRINFTNKS